MKRVRESKERSELICHIQRGARLITQNPLVPYLLLLSRLWEVKGKIQLSYKSNSI